jgi:hypothetical protein
LEALQFVFGPSAFGADGKGDLLRRGLRLENITQQILLFRLCQHDSQASREIHCLWKFHWRCNRRRIGLPRLFGRLQREAPPTFRALRRRGRQVNVCPTRDYRDDSRNTELSAFFNRPFHAIEFEDSEKEGDLRCGSSGKLLTQVEVDAVFCDRYYLSAPNRVTCRDFEFLTHSHTQHARQMVGVGAGETGTVTEYFVGDPSTAGHEMVAGGF